METDKLLITHIFYNKTYLEECDTAIHTLSVKTGNIQAIAKITTINYCNYNKAFSSLEILDSLGLEYYMEAGINGFKECLQEVQDYLIENNLLLFVEGFGMKAFNNKLNINQTKPTITNYDYITEDYYQER
jgi:hypothetical protein